MAVVITSVGVIACELAEGGHGILLISHCEHPKGAWQSHLPTARNDSPYQKQAHDPILELFLSTRHPE